ncbi:hypothetical protein OH779_04770 [Actinacidiphila glaucinigra]|uniref:hypothetical protein n=1 Tax=Actinacidiphila glaucinigra TaxID=235986 RepID=UPI00386CA101
MEGDTDGAERHDPPPRTRGGTASPLVPPEGLAVLDGLPGPAPHTGAELAALLGLLGDVRPPRAR